MESLQEAFAALAKGSEMSREQADLIASHLRKLIQDPAFLWWQEELQTLLVRRANNLAANPEISDTLCHYLRGEMGMLQFMKDFMPRHLASITAQLNPEDIEDGDAR